MDRIASWPSRAAAWVHRATVALRDGWSDLGRAPRALLLVAFAVGVLALAVLLGAFSPPNACDRSRPLVRDLQAYDGSRHLSRDAAVALRRDARQLDDVASRADPGLRRDLLRLADIAHQARAGHPFQLGAALAAYAADC
jgi:hypothetical protein